MVAIYKIMLGAETVNRESVFPLSHNTKAPCGHPTKQYSAVGTGFLSFKQN